MICIIDYGVGNLFSLKSSLAHLGLEAKVSADAADIRAADRLILPGVGAFGDAMAKLEATGLVPVIREEAAKKPLLGICLGMQLLFEKSYEYGEHDGLGFVPGQVCPLAPDLGDKSLKVPQIGRVIIQDGVEIGANSTVDRGALRDTVIGEGTKIDNLVQIGHNVVIGRHCVIVAQTGISGSAELGDFVVLGGQVGVVGHVKIGAGAQIAASSNVRGDVPPGVRWGGTPAKPTRLWFRELTILRQLAERKDLKFEDKDGE